MGETETTGTFTGELPNKNMTESFSQGSAKGDTEIWSPKIEKLHINCKNHNYKALWRSTSTMKNWKDICTHYKPNKTTELNQYSWSEKHVSLVQHWTGTAFILGATVPPTGSDWNYITETLCTVCKQSLGGLTQQRKLRDQRNSGLRVLKTKIT